MRWFLLAHLIAFYTCFIAGENLSQHNIKDGFTVHLVIKSSPSGSAQPNNRPASATSTTSAANSSSTSTPNTAANNQANAANPFAGMGGLGSLGLGGLGGLANMGMGNPNFQELQQRMQREMLNNPEMMRQIMDNPFVQQLMNNPEYMRAIITSNPQMQQLMEVKDIENDKYNCVFKSRRVSWVGCKPWILQLVSLTFLPSCREE